MSLLNTQAVADKVGITRKCLQSWIKKRRIAAPALVVGPHGHSVRLWDERSVAEVRQYKRSQDGKRKKGKK